MAKVLKTVAIVAVAVAVVVFAPQIAGVLASVAGSLGVTVAASAISSALIGMGISMALTAAATMFRKAPSMSQSLVDRLNTSVVPTASRKIVFGTTAAGQDVRFFEGDVDLPKSKKDGYVQVIALASHPISAFRDFYVENDLVWSNGTFLKHRGGFAPNNPFRVVTEGKPGNGFSVGSGRYWNSASTFTGCAYYVPFWKLDEEVWESGIPQRLTAIVDGCPLYDPRRDSTRGGSGSHRTGNQDTYAFRDGTVELGRNPALALLTYLLGWRINGKLVWGMGIPAHRIDFDNFRTYANLCEERVATQGGGTVQRYTVDGIFSTTDSHETIINGVTAAMGSCKLTDRGGTYCLVGGYDDTAGPKISFTADDLVAPANGSSPYIWNPAPPSRERYNIVRGRFANPDELYQLADWGDPIEQPPLADGIPRTLSIDLGAVSRAETCQRIAKQFLLREYLTPGMFSATFGPKAFAVEIGSVVTLSLPAEGWNNKLFRVMDQAETHDLFFQMTLREEDPQVYAWDREEKPLPLSIRPQGYDASATISPAGLALTSASYSGANGVNVSEVHVTWTPELSGRVSGIQIQSRPQGSDAWTEQAALFDPKLGTFTFTSNAPGITVEVQARFRMSSAVYSPWVMANVETAAVETIDTTARDNAGSALDKAGKAEGTANTAKDTADTAKGTADAAQKTADEARKALQDDKGVIIKASDLRQEIGALKDTYGSTENANAAKLAAEAARDTSKTHADNSKQASDQSAAARDAAQRILTDTTTQSGLAEQAKKAAETARDAAQQSKSDASGFATTASGQAGIAKQEADKSGSSAALAKGDADRAATKAGEASTSAGKALTSEQNAEGSKNSAETFSKVAATTTAQTYPSDFSQGAKFWAPLQGDPATVELDMAGREFITDPAEGPVMRITNPGIYRQTRPRALIPNIAGRRYRIEARVRVKSDGPLPVTFVIGGYGLQADFRDISYANHLEVNTYSYANNKVAADGWSNIWLEVTATGTTCPWLSPSVYVYSTNSTGQVDPGNCAVEYRYIKVSEVTESAKAGKSAEASATSAANAKASETKAGQSADAADGSRVAAQTAKGQAEAAQSKAATSESNAASSASSAAAKEALTASTYRSVISATGNEQFNNGIDGWDGLGASVLVSSSAGRSNVIRTPVSATYHAVQGRKVPVTSADQRFELRSSLRCAAGQSVYYVGAIFYDADDKVVAALDGTGNYALGSGYAVDSATNSNWIDREVVIGKGLNVSSEYGGTRNIPAATVYFRPCIYINYLSNAASITEVDYYTVADVTSQQKAGSAATAASVSASNAAASETVAGQKASAASGSADTANTKAGEASGSASRAAVSERNAEGSKNSASSSATLAAKSYIDTVRVGRNDDFEQGTDGWRHSPTEGYLASGTWEPARNIAGRASTLKQRNVGDDYLYADYLVPVASGRSYQFETSYFVENGSGTSLQYLGFQCIGADGNYVTGNTGHFYWSAPTTSAGAGWSNHKSGVYVAGRDLPAGTTHIRPLILYNYLNNTNLGLGHVDYIRCLDVTESEKAAGSAAASTQQASTATTKATEAGQSASAANSSRADAANLAADARREAKNASDQAAVATEKASAASSSQTLAATYASKLTAMNLDSEMERDVAPSDCWCSDYNGTGQVDGKLSKTIAWNNVSCMFLGASQGVAQFFSKKAIQVDTRRSYRISARVGAWNNGSTGNGSIFYVGFVGLDASGAIVDHGGYGGTFRYAATRGGPTVTDGQIVEYSEVVTGEGNDSFVKFPPGTKQIRLFVIMNYVNAPVHSYVDYVRFEDVTESLTANASAQVATSQAATATAQAAAAQRSAVLSASLSGGLIGLNTKFADYPDSHYSSAPPGWAVWSAGSALRRTYGNGSLSDPNPLSIEGSPWGVNMVNPGSGDGSAGIYQEVRATGGKYVIEATAELGDGGWNGSGVLLYALDASKNWIGQAWIDFTNEADINGTTANTIANIYKVRRFSKPVTVPGGTNCAYIRVYAMTGWTGFTGSSNYKYMTWFKCGIRSTSNAEAQVATHEGAIANLQAKTATAWSEKTVAVPGAEAAIRMIATNANGVPTANIALVAPQIALFNTANGQVIPTFKAEGGNVSIAGDLRGGAGRIIFDNGSVMKVSGTGFGSRSQFIEWFGPRQDNLANCTEANASYYLKTDGSSYFGGSLSAGVLKNSVQTTSLAADANVTTGTFGSNGRSRVVTVGYNMAGYTSITGGCPAPYTPYAVVRLYRGTNSGGTLLAEQQFNGSHQCEAGQGQYEPGYYSDNIGGSFTYTDNSGGSQASYYVQIVGRYTGVLNQQSLGVTSVEQ